MATINAHIQLRNDTAENWTNANPVLLKGEMGVEIDTGKTKIGNGTDHWTTLKYSGGDEISKYGVTVTSSTVEGLAKRYTIHQDATGLDVNIDIPTDMVVKSGAVVTNPEGQTGTYLVLTLANATNDKVYIDVGNLIEYVTSGSGANDMVKIAVSADHKVTASITDGSITKAKLATAVQNSLDKADSAIQQIDLTTALEPYAKTNDVARDYVAKEAGKRLMTDAEGTKLEGIEAGAQVNKIESVKVGGTALEITEKAVNISQISTDLLVNGTNTLILNCGSANE